MSRRERESMGLGYGSRDNDSGNAGMENSSHAKLQEIHNSKDEFVKRQQAETAMMGGRNPRLSEKSMHMNAYMCNNGEHAKEFGRELTAGLDKKAFPVK